MRATRRGATRGAVAVWLRSTSYPRLVVAAAVTCGVAGGWAFSALLLNLGVASMGLRYPLSMLAGYGVFVLVVGRQVLHYSGRALNDQQAIVHVAQRLREYNKENDPDPNVWIDSGMEILLDSDALNESDDPFPASFLILFGLTIVGPSLWLILHAPFFLGALLVEGAFVGWHYQPPHRSRPNFPAAMLEMTAGTALIMAFALCVAGIGFQLSVPHATTIGDVLRNLRAGD